MVECSCELQCLVVCDDTIYTLPRNWKPFTCMASDAIVKSSPLVFLIIWVAYIFEIPQLLIMAIGVV